MKERFVLTTSGGMWMPESVVGKENDVPRSAGVGLTWILLAFLAGLALLPLVGCAVDPLDPLGKCGHNGTVDADPNPVVPLPHCG